MLTSYFLKMKHLQLNRGHTVLEIVIALGLAGLLILIIFKISEDAMSTVKKNQLVGSRDQIASWVRQSAGNLRGLQASLKKPGNEPFYNCVCGKGAGCSSAQTYDFTLYDFSDINNPIKTYFDHSGNPCLNTSPNCAIEVTLKFIAQCMPTLPSADPTPPVSCTGAPVEFVAILYSVHQNPSTLSQGQLLKPISGSVFTTTSKLIPPGSGLCL